MNVIKFKKKHLFHWTVELIWLIFTEMVNYLTNLTATGQLSKTFIGGAVCREFESEAPAAEEMLDWVVCSSEQFCFQMCLECGDGSGTFRNWRQWVPDSWCRDAECLDLKLILAAVSVDEDEYSFELTFVTAPQFVSQHSGQCNIMLLSSSFNFVCTFVSQGIFPISCYNSYQILF